MNEVPIPFTNPRVVRRALSVIFFIMLMDVIGITILIPVTPYIVARYSSDALTVTLITVIYAAAQFFAAPFLGKLGDRLGRRPVLLGSVLGSAVGYLIFGFGGALWILFVSRLIDGISGGNMSTASAYIADVSKPEERARNFTLIGMAWGFGLIAGPALGSVFSQITLEAPAFAAAFFSLLSVILGYFFLPESLPPEQRHRDTFTLHDLNPFASIGEVARKPGVGWPLLALCLFNFAFTGINSTQGLFFIHKFNAEPQQVGFVLVLIGVVVAIVQAFLVQPAVARYGEKTVATLSLLGQVILAIATFFAPLFLLVYVTTVLANAVSSFTFPTLTALSANLIPQREQGVFMGVSAALASLMSVLGPLWAGIAYDHIVPGAPYWSAALGFGLAAFILMRLKANQPQPVNPSSSTT